MNKKQKYLRLVLSVVLSSLLATIAVFAIVHAETYLRENDFRVDGPALINALNPGATIGLLIPEGDVGIGFTTIPQSKLDVNGWVRASGGRFDTVIVDGVLGIGAEELVSDLGLGQGSLVVGERHSLNISGVPINYLEGIILRTDGFDHFLESKRKFLDGGGTIDTDFTIRAARVNVEAPLEAEELISAGGLSVDCSICLGWADSNRTIPDRQQCQSLSSGRVETNRIPIKGGADVDGNDSFFIWFECPGPGNSASHSSN